MSIYGLVSDQRLNTSEAEWYKAERYDYCEQDFSNKDKKNSRSFKNILSLFLNSMI